MQNLTQNHNLTYGSKLKRNCQQSWFPDVLNLNNTNNIHNQKSTSEYYSSGEFHSKGNAQVDNKLNQDVKRPKINKHCKWPHFWKQCTTYKTKRKWIIWIFLHWHTFYFFRHQYFRCAQCKYFFSEKLQINIIWLGTFCFQSRFPFSRLFLFL